MTNKNYAARAKRVERLKRKYEGVDFELFRKQVYANTIAMNEDNLAGITSTQRLASVCLTILCLFVLTALFLAI